MISVLINSHERPKGLDRALLSLASQTYTDFEVIICDDTAENKIMEDMVKHYTNNFGLDIKYHHSPPIGAAEALQIALAQSSRPYVKILHDDDYYDTHAIEYSILYMEANKDCNLGLNRALIRFPQFDKEFYNSGDQLFKVPSENYVNNHLLMGKPFQSPVCGTFRRHKDLRIFWEYDNLDLRDIARRKGAGPDIQLSVETAMSAEYTLFIPRTLSFLCTDMDSCTQTTPGLEKFYSMWVEEYVKLPKWRIYK